MNEFLKWFLSTILALALLRFVWEVFDYWRQQRALPAPATKPWRPDTYSAIEQAQLHMPVNVHSLAETLGLEVKRTPMHESVAGEICHLGLGNYTCVLNSMHRPLQQRFTLAHQIGHYVLHRGLLGNGTSDSDQYKCVPGSEYRNSRITEREETEATDFARWLLIPRKPLKKFRNWGLNIERIAEHFEVEPEIVEAELLRTKLDVVDVPRKVAL